MSRTEDWARLEGGELKIGGRQFKLPNLSLLREIGRGANAVVFEGIDDELERRVAIKVWNARGKSRAKFETAKIAKINHPLIVTTHRFGFVGDNPFAVMELISGMSGKEWVAGVRDVRDKVHLWNLYSKSLRYIHDTGAVHGDPHLGNLIVFPDPSGKFRNFGSSDDPSFALKIADMGTSVFWRQRSDIEKRERKLISETADRLFRDSRNGWKWNLPTDLDYSSTLVALDGLVDYIGYMNSSGWWDHRSQQAGEIVRRVISVPIFDMDDVIYHVKSSSLTDFRRFCRRMNGALIGSGDIVSAEDAIIPETRMKYNIIRENYLKALRK